MELGNCVEEAKDTVISTIEAASALRVEGYSSQRALFTKKIRIVRPAKN